MRKRYRYQNKLMILIELNIEFLVEANLVYNSDQT